MWSLEIDETRPLVAGQRKDGGVHIGMDMLHAEVLIDALHGLFGRVVVLAKMTKHDVLDAGMVDLGHKTRRLVVAQMSEGTRDTLLEDKGIVAFLQHLLVVVGLNDDVIRPFDLLLHHLIKHPYIGSDGQRMSFKIKMIAHRTTTIVHHGEWLNGDATDLERLHRLDLVKQSRVDLFRHPAFKEALQAVGMGIDRDGI